MCVSVYGECWKQVRAADARWVYIYLCLENGTFGNRPGKYLTFSAVKRGTIVIGIFLDAVIGAYTFTYACV